MIKNDQKKRPHLGIVFKCCRIYSRIYLNKKGDAYIGWCPKCASKMEVVISPYGSQNKFFFAE